jgi:hypothetical protein
MRYLIIRYIKKPDGKYAEQAEMANKISNRVYPTASVILDYCDKKVVKAVIDGKVLPKDFARFDEYYYGVLPDVVKSIRIANS